MESNQREEKRKKLIDILMGLVTPGLVLIGLCVLAAVNLFSTQALYTKLSSIENRLSNTSGTTDLTDIKLPPDAPYMGKKNAPITIIEFADLQCPYCKDFHDKILPRIKSEYINKDLVKFVFVNFAFLGDESKDAAMATKCAQDQGKYWEYQDLLYAKQSGENTGNFDLKNLKKYALDLGLITEEFNSCMDSKKYEQLISSESLLASDYGVNSTPTIFINGKRFEGVVPFYQIDQEIQKLIKATQK